MTTAQELKDRYTGLYDYMATSVQIRGAFIITFRREE